MEKKLRAPDTIEDAVVQAKALLGEGAIAHALDVSGSLIVKWSDHDDKAHRIGCHQALSIDLLLVEAGHVPVFVALFEAQRPAPVVVQEKADPVQLAMQATTDTAVLMEDVARAAARGEVASRHARRARGRSRDAARGQPSAVASRAHSAPPAVRGAGLPPTPSAIPSPALGYAAWRLAVALRRLQRAAADAPLGLPRTRSAN